MDFLELVEGKGVGRRQGADAATTTSKLQSCSDSSYLDAQVLYSLKCYEAAAREAEAAAATCPDDSDVSWLLAACYVKLGLVNSAVAELRRCMSLCSAHPDAWAVLEVLEADAAAEDGRFEDVVVLGEAFLEKANSVGYRDAHSAVLSRIARACSKLGRDEEAVAAQRRAVALRPGNKRAWARLARLQMRAAEREGGLEAAVDGARWQIEEAQALGLSDLEVLAGERMSSACSKLGRHREARDAQRRVVTLRPGDAKCQIVLVLREIAVASEAGDTVEVASLAASGLQISQDLGALGSLKTEVGQLYRALVPALLDLGDLSLGLQAAQQFKAHSPDDPQAYRWLSDILERLERPGEAVDVQLKVIELVPHDRSAKDQLERKLKSLEKTCQRSGCGTHCGD